jgi:2-polyprenyl-6-methoxyphenol hydroxylase-like FAD-dependent oxidoreductase
MFARRFQAPMTSSVIDVDVAIVGGGIAGSSLAITLARAGVSVAVVEREATFRDRIRGESLWPWGAALAGELGIRDALPESGSHPLPIWQTYHERQPDPPYDWRPDVPSGDVMWGVSHPGLQTALLRRAEEAGAIVLRPARARRPERDRSGGWILPVESASGRTAVHARLIVGADGRESAARGWIGATTLRDPVHHVIGGCLVAGVALNPDAAHAGFYPGGAVFVLRQASGRARAYLFTRPEVGRAMRGAGAADALIATAAAAFPEGAFAAVRAAGPAAFFPAADIFASDIAGEGIVLIGDAAAANDPTQGQGLSLVFKDVHELSRLLLTSDDWQGAIITFAQRRPAWYEPLRAYAAWRGPLITGIGPEADAARARAQRAQERDPLLAGYSSIYTLGPDGLPVTDAPRPHVLGEDLDVGDGVTG